ncbi:MAG: hypothetical protein FWF91_06470 [Coriobacteriia bacterium]|nr:hypothetical protein [Coriobacteriia bacterium]
MKTKRRMAASSAFIAVAIVVAGFASAGQKSMIPLNILTRNPFFTFMVFITCVSLIAVAVMATMMWHKSNTSCENTACSFHPGYQGVNKGFDFSTISTPEEFLNIPKETKEQSSVEDKREWMRKNQERLPELETDDPAGETNLARGVACPLEPPQKICEVPDPQPLNQERQQALNPNMEFTDEMVIMVIERLRRQERQGYLQAS